VELRSDAPLSDITVRQSEPIPPNAFLKLDTPSLLFTLRSEKGECVYERPWTLIPAIKPFPDRGNISKISLNFPILDNAVTR
jgi:hypothetical protein